MNVLKAMEMTLELARSVGLDEIEYDIPATDYNHLVDLYNRALVGGYSEGKINRHLGFMQGVVLCWGNGDVTLDQLKATNMECA